VDKRLYIQWNARLLRKVRERPLGGALRQRVMTQDFESDGEASSQDSSVAAPGNVADADEIYDGLFQVAAAPPGSQRVQRSSGAAAAPPSSQRVQRSSGAAAAPGDMVLVHLSSDSDSSDGGYVQSVRRNGSSQGLNSSTIRSCRPRKRRKKQHRAHDAAADMVDADKAMMAQATRMSLNSLRRERQK